MVIHGRDARATLGKSSKAKTKMGSDLRNTEQAKTGSEAAFSYKEHARFIQYFTAESTENTEKTAISYVTLHLCALCTTTRQDYVFSTRNLHGASRKSC